MKTCTLKEYVQSKESYESKIVAIEALIDAMMINALDTIEDSGTASFSMDDGQMKVTTDFRSMSEITKGIHSLDSLKQMYINRRNGHIVVLRGRKNY